MNKARPTAAIDSAWTAGVDRSRLGALDMLLLVVFWLSVLWALDPFQMELDYMGGVKHVPLAAFWLVFGSLLIVRQLGGEIKAVDWPRWKPSVPVLLLGLWVTVGSMIQRSSSDLDNSFLNMGITMPMAALAVALTLLVRAPWKWIEIYVAGVACAAFATGCLQVVKFDAVEVIHGHEYMIAPFAAWALFRFEGRGRAWTLALCFVLFAFAAKKNTAYLTILLTLSYLLVLAFRSRWPGLDVAGRGLLVIGFFTLVLVLAAVVAYILSRRDEYLPTGNTNFRTFTYLRAWEKFLGSPIYGTGFTGPASEFFPLFTVESSTQVLPTHSDFLDILANGGVIGVLMWLSGMFWMLLGSLRLAFSSNPLPRRIVALLHLVNLASLCAIVTCLFNPVFQYPNTSWTVWTLFGLALAMPALLQPQGRPSAAVEPRGFLMARRVKVAR